MRINKLRLFNFKRFEFLEVSFKDNLNVIIGDNESGKSSLLQAIDLTLSGSRSKIESIGLDLLFNSNSIDNFFKVNTYETLPKLIVELYFDDFEDPDFFGRNNSHASDFFGISLNCEPREDLSKEIVSP